MILNCIGEMPGKLSLLRENGFDSCQLLSWNPVLLKEIVLVWQKMLA